MKAELRSYGLILIAETAQESAMIDQCFGPNIIQDDGLIGESTCECRLSDGIGPHYILIKNVLQKKDPNVAG